MATKTAAAPPTEKAVAKFDPNAACTVQQLNEIFTKSLPRIREALPPSMQKHAERMVRVAVGEIQRNPTLAKCSGLSILSCVVQAATLGLEIGGPMGHAYMVPYGNKATFQIGYRGMIALAFRSGEVSGIYANVVRQKDKFRLLSGTTPGIEHEPAVKDAGDVTGVYAVLVFKSGQIMYEYMTREEVEHHRRTYSKQPQSMLWTSAWNEAAKKTVTRRLLKYAPLAVELPSDLDDGPVETVTQTASPQLTGGEHWEKCDGNHGMPRCGAKPGECWHDDRPLPIDDQDDGAGEPSGALFGGDGEQVQQH